PALDRARAGGALAELRSSWREQTGVRVPFLTVAPYHRLRQGELLATLGQATVADRWYASIPTSDSYDVVLAAPAVAARARLAESQGRYMEAAGLYERFAELWAACEPELRAAVVDAQLRAAQLRR